MMPCLESLFIFLCFFVCLLGFFFLHCTYCRYTLHRLRFLVYSQEQYSLDCASGYISAFLLLYSRPRHRHSCCRGGKKKKHSGGGKSRRQVWGCVGGGGGGVGWSGRGASAVDFLIQALAEGDGLDFFFFLTNTRHFQICRVCSAVRGSPRYPEETGQRASGRWGRSRRRQSQDSAVSPVWFGRSEEPAGLIRA